MAMVTKVEAFMNGPLISWISSHHAKSSSDPLSYEDVIDGVAVQNLFLQTGLSVINYDITPSGKDPQVRLNNLQKIVANMCHALEEDLDCMIVRRPNVEELAMNPQHSVDEADLMLGMLLSCAISCPNKATFINDFWLLDVKTQQYIMEYIKQIDDTPDIVLKAGMLMLKAENKDYYAENVSKAFDYMRRIYKECSELRNNVNQVNVEELYPIMKRQTDSLNRAKSRLREQQLELDQNTDDLVEWKRSLEESRTQLAKLQKDKERLELKDRETKILFDEILGEKTRKITILEEQIVQYKQKVKEHEHCKAEINKLYEKIGELQETTEKLNTKVREDGAKIKNLTLEVNELNDTVDELTGDKENLLKSYNDVLVENTELHSHVKARNSTAFEDESFGPEEEFDYSFDFKNSTAAELLEATAQAKFLGQQLAESLQVHSIACSPLEAPKSEMETNNDNNNQPSVEDVEESDESSCDDQDDSVDYERQMLELEMKHKRLQMEYQFLVQQRHCLGTLNDNLQKQTEDNLEEAKRELRELKLNNETLTQLVKDKESAITNLESANKVLKSQLMELQALVEETEPSETSPQSKATSKVQLFIPEPNRTAYLSKAYKQVVAERDSLLQLKETLDNEKELMKEVEEEKASIDWFKNKVDILERQLGNERKKIERFEIENEQLRDQYITLEDYSQKFADELKDIFYRLNEQNYNSRCPCRVSCEALDKSWDMQDNHFDECHAKERQILELQLELDNMQFTTEQNSKTIEGLKRINAQLMKDNTDLLSQMQNLYHRLLDEKEMHFSEKLTTKQNLAAVVRQKEKLELKLMDTYKKMNSVPLKKKNRITTYLSQFTNTFRNKTSRNSSFSEKPNRDKSSHSSGKKSLLSKFLVKNKKERNNEIVEEPSMESTSSIDENENEETTENENEKTAENENEKTTENESEKSTENEK